MSRFRKLSQTIWHCQYHIVWCPKYRFRVLGGEIKIEVEECIKSFVEAYKYEVIELNVQIDHVHLLVIISPKISVSKFVGTVNGRATIRVLNKFRKLKKNPFWDKKNIVFINFFSF
jgi:putative transposase